MELDERRIKLIGEARIGTDFRIYLGIIAEALNLEIGDRVLFSFSDEIGETIIRKAVAVVESITPNHIDGTSPENEE